MTTNHTDAARATGARFIVCPRCEGVGSIDNANFNGFTADDRAEFDDFASDYATGAYSESCPACKGQRVMTPAAVAEWEAEEEQRWAMEREYRAESASYWMGY